ncbi:MAG: family 20 glycosylhydrolase [Bacteroides sp.]|nr:family 20 glycosylhydrolase [Bacteroides sp.]MCM1379322.1 family 20 glycosylhydrolase [Bacteroides sp.]MCM1445019.1 family 20 glycosylhydrolase [Prevotella sp.]
MKIKRLFLAVALTVGALASYAVNPKPFTVPEVSGWKGGDGLFKPSAQTTRIVPTGAEAERIARMFSQDYTTIGGTELPVVDGKVKKGDISLKIKPNKKANDESYTIEITPKGVNVTAPNEHGLYWATRTLLQMTENSADGVSLPVGTITDSPAYGMRGFMIDTGRKFIPLDYLYALVDAMSYYKMNTLHIHLNDNAFPRSYDKDWNKTPAGFRIESEKFPVLASRDGHYTKQEFRDLQKYAASKGIEIIPEFDFPAHSLAFTKMIPEIASTGRNGRDHLDINNPKTHEFLEALIDEYIGGDDPVFVGPRFHIGTDEYQGDSLLLEQFRGFTDRYIKYVEKYGKQPAIWGSLTHAKGQTPVKSDGVLMYIWSNGYAQPKDMLKQGYDVISIPDGYVYIVPKAGYYYDYLNTDYLYNNWTPANIGGYKVTGDTLKQVKGGMFAVWNDEPDNGITTKDIAHRIMDALPTMAAKTWSSEVTVPYAEFREKSKKMSEAPGTNYLARYGTPGAKEVILTLDVVAPGQTLPIPEIGYDYTVEFDVEGATEAPGTKLFESPNAVFWLSDPISGRMGFSREGQLNTFRRQVLPGDKLHVKVVGDNESTKLYVDDILVDNLDVRWDYLYQSTNKEGKDNFFKRAKVRTLVFPLDQAGNFRSKVTNLTVSNYK